VVIFQVIEVVFCILAPCSFGVVNQQACNLLGYSYLFVEKGKGKFVPVL
jgi:hypothetical protein